MRKDLMTGAVVAVFALIVPLGLVLFESRPSARKSVKKPVAKATEPQAATVEPTPTLAVAALVPDPSEPAINESPEVASNDTLVSDVAFFGGREADSTRPQTSPVTEPAEPKPDPRSLAEIIAAVEIGTITPDPMPTESELTEEEELIAASFEQLVAENAKIEQTGARVVATDKAKKAEPEDALNRVVVTYVRPKDKTVHATESIIGKTTAKGIPVFLVRSRQPNSTWWVQESAIKQGIYFRASARFGNAHTPDGTAFDFVIAFVPKLDEVPKLGSELTALPPEWSYSPEMIYTLKRN